MKLIGYPLTLVKKHKHDDIKSTYCNVMVPFITEEGETRVANFTRSCNPSPKFDCMGCPSLQQHHFWNICLWTCARMDILGYLVLRADTLFVQCNSKGLCWSSLAAMEDYQSWSVSNGSSCGSSVQKKKRVGCQPQLRRHKTVSCLLDELLFSLSALNGSYTISLLVVGALKTAWDNIGIIILPHEILLPSLLKYWCHMLKFVNHM
jgi:hypothetical protein